jgi:hypothetical protein
MGLLQDTCKNLQDSLLTLTLSQLGNLTFWLFWVKNDTIECAFESYFAGFRAYPVATPIMLNYANINYIFLSEKIAGIKQFLAQ